MLPVEHNDPINAKILAISEDKIEGFVREPFEEIANHSRVGVEIVMARIAAMLRAKTIRRVRQTLLATNLAKGALVAWKVPEDRDRRRVRLDVSARSVFGSRGAALHRHCHRWVGLQTLDDSEGSSGIFVARALRIAVEKSRRGAFSSDAGERNFHSWGRACSRKTIEPGSKADQPAKMIPVQVAELSEQEWNVLLALKREFTPEEIKPIAVGYAGK